MNRDNIIHTFTYLTYLERTSSMLISNRKTENFIKNHHLTIPELTRRYDPQMALNINFQANEIIRNAKSTKEINEKLTNLRKQF